MKSKQSNFTSLYRGVALYLLAYLLLCFLPPMAMADVMTNDNYNIDTENITIDNILHITLPNTVIKPVNPIQAKPQKSYQIEDGFANSRLSLALSQDIIDFGTISSADPVVRNDQISITNTIGSYQVITYEDHQLTATTSATIPDTTCDNGSCSEDTPAQWSSALTYGFGYHCTNTIGSPCSNNFIQADYYSPFSNLKQQQVGTPIMESLIPTKLQQTEITYKVVISGTQQVTSYSNTITYLAVPGF